MDQENTVEGGGEQGVKPPMGVNANAVQQYFNRTVHRMGMKTKVVSLPPCPPPSADSSRDRCGIQSILLQSCHQINSDQEDD